MSKLTILNTYEDFINVFEKKSGLDLNAYKRNQMERRIVSFMHIYKYTTFSGFYKALEDQTLYNAFFKHLTINVSQFFRDTNQWKMLQELIIPKYLLGRKTLKIWSAGCSGGQEPYTLAIFMQEYFPNIYFSILASDIDENVLLQAKNGIYKKNDFISTPPEILEKYFTPSGNDYKINDNILKLVKLQKHNLLTDYYETGFDLITCRNVVIYFTEDTKKTLYKKFYNSLNEGGILFTGSTEHLYGLSEVNLKQVNTFFYQK